MSFNDHASRICTTHSWRTFTPPWDTKYSWVDEDHTLLSSMINKHCSMARAAEVMFSTHVMPSPSRISEQYNNTSRTKLQLSPTTDYSLQHWNLYFLLLKLIQSFLQPLMLYLHLNVSFVPIWPMAKKILLSSYWEWWMISKFRLLMKLFTAPNVEIWD